MTTFLQRYMDGDHEKVWADLVELGTQVRQEPVLSDAKAVARETMRRARINVELIVERLQAIGYDFEDAPNSFVASSPQLVKQLDKFERKVGPLPLSVRAWFEVVGEVNLMGSYPLLSYYAASSSSFLAASLGAGGLKPSDLMDLMQSMQSPSVDPSHLPDLTNRLNNHLTDVFSKLDAFSPGMLDLLRNSVNKKASKPAQPVPPDAQVLADPLVMFVGELSIDWYDEWKEMRDAGEVDDPFTVTLAPDIQHKSNISGSGGYEIVLPNAAADLDLLYAPQETTFVNYLRESFAWGGFPGLREYQTRADDVLSTLRQGLLPI